MSIRDKFQQSDKIAEYIRFFKNYQGTNKRILKAKREFEAVRMRAFFDSLNEPIRSGEFRRFDSEK